MNYNINIREEIFGATLFNLEIGKREYITKQELEDILEKEKFPKDSIANNKVNKYNIKFTPLSEKKENFSHFTFADIAFIELTRACNLRCKHCLNNSGVAMNNQLSINELLTLVEKLSYAGVQEIRFTGGEPLLFKDIYKFIKLATENGIYVSLGTNGTLVTENVAKKLRQSGLKKVVVSIDGTKIQHNLIRGEGNFEKSMSGLNYLDRKSVV